MANLLNMRLCGGTFLVLLFEARGQRRASRMSEGRPGDGKSNPEVMARLVRSVNPDFQMPSGRSFNTFTSDYKLCRTSDTPAAGITDEQIVQRFDHQVKTKYYEYLGLFYGLLENAISWGVKGPWLVAALIDLIEADSTIPSDALFYVRPYGQPVKKSELRKIECICTPSFLLGVWHYIITKIRDNTVGVDTISHFLDDSGESRSERKFVSNIGSQTVDSIEVSLQPPKCETENYRDPALEKAMRDIPLAFVSPGVAADVRNIQNGQIFVDSKQVFYLDSQEHATPPSNAGGSYGLHEPDLLDTYLEKATAFYSTVKTLLYSEAPHPFKDLYVPNDIKIKSLNESVNGKVKDRPIEVLACEYFGNIIIRGTGGIGKSMMMRHLFLYYAERYNEKHILPVLVPLKNFTDMESNLEDFIYKAAYEFDHDLKFADFEPLLKNGKCLILLDGLDEIPLAYRHAFEKHLVSFLKAYQHNHIVLSSRPTCEFIQFGHFLVCEIEPFSKAKALELIDKLEYHDPVAKAKFREDLDRKLYRSHEQFASNPLLLTIMLMTYTSYGEVPAKRHIFYAKAYETMARLHDASKGAYVRPMHTGLSPEDFAVYFAEFCARTYKAEVLEFTAQSFSECMNKVIAHQRIPTNATARDFLLDLTDNLCIMYKEGEKYYFIHRSFQEYFSAVFFSNQMDDQLGRIGDFFEHQAKRMQGDRTFDMLYDMIPDRIDRYIFLPFLKDLWARCDADNGYWTFLEEMYPTIFAQEGEAGDFYENDPESNLFNFFVNETLHRHNGELYNIKWPDAIDYCGRKEWCSIETNRHYKNGVAHCYTEVVEFDSVDPEYIDMHGEPEIEGVSWEIQISELLRRPDRFCELIAFMEDDSFPLKKEYNEMREITERMDKSINSKPSSDDWFDAF